MIKKSKWKNLKANSAKIRRKIWKSKNMLVPEEEIEEWSSRSSGHGGQNINKRSTKSTGRWNVDSSAKFTTEEKEKIKEALKLTKDGDLIVSSQEERNWFQNRKRMVEKMNDKVRWALLPEKERKPTKPTLASKERRLQEKKRLGEKKKWRSNPPTGGPKNSDY